MFTSMAGAITTGALVANTVQHSTSSAMPVANLAMTLAVAGAIATTSAALARAIWVTLSSEEASNMSVATVLPVIARKLSGDTNLVAFSVITTSTFAPALLSWLAISTAL